MKFNSLCEIFYSQIMHMTKGNEKNNINLQFVERRKHQEFAKFVNIIHRATFLQKYTTAELRVQYQHYKEAQKYIIHYNKEAQK